ncbi:hypothetical protein TWF594_004255 [Orbilia oligospora]|nr:hypothetical protein TWF706_004384 [Orbilia oligospora]KAF3145300.1 hypothetical protein TWF594_004255 [Orbilia oligospora]
MAPELPSSCCMRGSLHTGNPTGTEETIHNLPTYVAQPENSNGTVNGTIVIIPDVFGWDLINLRLLADSYAKRGNFRVLMPDVHFGDAFAKDSLDVAFPLKGFEPPWYKRLWTMALSFPKFLLWFWTHRESVSLPIITKFFKSLREELNSTPGGGKLGVIGFCWGGRHAILMNPYVDAIYSAHPSFLKVPAEVEAVTKPISFAVGDKDIVLPMKQVERIKGILKKKEGLDSEVVVYEGMEHSFAVRGNPAIEAAKKGLEGSETQAVEWFIKHLA